uniref:lysozyme n=1 Tax=Naja naja TaxID=35670 RepID=A0A8C6XAG2_NAJNA
MLTGPIHAQCSALRYTKSVDKLRASEGMYYKQHKNLKNNRLIQFFGIFQINSYWWCDNNQGYSANLCKVSCSALIDDDVRDDIACAKKIVLGRKKMNAWDDWQRNCKGKNISKWTSDCKLDSHYSG